MLKKINTILLMVGFAMNLSACSPNVSWKEEVKLNDGRVIVVKRKERVEGNIPREAWLTIDLPELNPQPVAWHENLVPLVVNIDEGRLYVVGYPSTPFEARKNGCLTPWYYGFVWENDKWNRIPFEKIPQRIYAVNMLLEGHPPDWTFLLTLGEKNSADMNGASTHYYQRAINPNDGNGC